MYSRYVMIRKGCLMVLLNTCWVYHIQIYMLNSVPCYISMQMLALHNYQLKYLLLMALLINTT